MCDKVEKAQVLLDNAERTQSLKHIVVFESVTRLHNTELAEKHGIQVITFRQLEEEGRKHIQKPKVSCSIYNCPCRALTYTNF